MPPMKNRTNMAESNKSNYTAQSPEENCDFESVDEMLDDVTKFVEGVYRVLGLTPTQSPSSNAGGNQRSIEKTPRSLAEELNEASSPLINSTDGAIGGALSLTTNDHGQGSGAGCSVPSIISPRQFCSMDEEIEKINRMCKKVAESLRSSGVTIPNVRGVTDISIQEENPSHSDNLNSISDIALNSTSTATTAEQRFPRVDMINSVDASRPTPPIVVPQIIDLCESQTSDVAGNPPPLRNTHEDDDDVVIVSSNINPVIDLCTPGSMKPPSRRALTYDQIHRRRLHEDVEDVIAVKKPTIVKANTNIRNSPPENSPPPPSPAALMCAVCMESCLQRQPTSTKCGHLFCNECILQATRLTRKCPLCNTKISKPSQLFRLYL